MNQERLEKIIFITSIITVIIVGNIVGALFWLGLIINI